MVNVAEARDDLQVLLSLAGFVFLITRKTAQQYRAARRIAGYSLGAGGLAFIVSQILILVYQAPPLATNMIFALCYAPLIGAAAAVLPSARNRGWKFSRLEPSKLSYWTR